MPTIKDRLRTATYVSGLFSAFNRIAHGRLLTVVMFHRVLPSSDPRWQGADPTYTVTPGLLADCLRFFRRHYAPIGLSDLVSGSRLPSRALLVTFDDGWSDTVEYALPLLREVDCPAVLFVAAGHVGSLEGFWQERLFSAWRRGALSVGTLTSQARLRHLLSGEVEAEDDEAGLRRIIAALGRSDARARSEFCDDVAPRQEGSPPAMASAEMLRAAVNGGMDLGVHGFSHEPLDTVDVRDELDRAASVLRSISGTRPTTLSFPHGRYDDAAVADARELGFDLLFTSDPVLNRLAIGRTGPAADILGRIAITTAAVTRGPSAGLDPARLANWLINRAPVARSSR